MIHIKLDELGTKVEQAMANMDADDAPKLFSVTKKIASLNPLHVFEGAKLFQKDRFYWMNSDRTLAITGVGSVRMLEAKNERYRETEEQWRRLLKHAWVENNYPDVPATGIVAFGGMDFDPLKRKTELWKHFKTALFYIPEIMLTVHHSDYYVTMNTLIEEADRPQEVLDRLMDLQEAFLKGKSIQDDAITVVNRHEVEPERWKQSVRKAMTEMQEEKVEKIVLAREMQLQFERDVNIAQVLKTLYETQPDSYLFAFESEGDCFVGATPERLVKLEKNKLLSACLAGTAPRGKTKKEDEQIGQGLLNDKKNRDEHHFVVEMIRDALEKTCVDVQMPNAPVLRPLTNLQHLYTPVTGVLKEGYSIFDVVKHLHPTPALGGTPTDYSLRFIRDNEVLDRGWYGAPIGWIDSDENGEFAVAIRSALIRGKKASLFAGCGVLPDSDPEMEFEETRIKMLPMLNVLGGHQE